MTVTGYASDRVLVDADWAQAHLTDPNVRFVEVDVDTTAYSQGHLPGAVGWDWTSQLSDGVRRDLASREDFSALLSKSGIGPDTTVVLYGDNNNWFAAFAYWQLKLFGHDDVRILNGGRKYWLDHGLPITTDEPSPTPTDYQLPERDDALRAYRDDILPRLGDAGLALVDVRSPAEFNGEIIAPPGMSETAQRAGRIPGAASIPWAPDRPRGRHVQELGRAPVAVRGEGRHARQGRHRLLPDRRAVEPLVVRPPRAARLSARPQLRRIVDRVGQPDRRADREAGGGRRRVGSRRAVRPGFRPGAGGSDRAGPARLPCRTSRPRSASRARGGPATPDGARDGEPGRARRRAPAATAASTTATGRRPARSTSRPRRGREPSNADRATGRRPSTTGNATPARGRRPERPVAGPIVPGQLELELAGRRRVERFDRQARGIGVRRSPDAPGPPGPAGRAAATTAPGRRGGRAARPADRTS